MKKITQPLFLEPIMMERVWGGNRLAHMYGKTVPDGKIIGESWELADRPEAQSRVRGGPFAGQNLGPLLKEHAEAILGPELAGAKLPCFPLLIKYVDAAAALSVQVHPDDAGAKAFNDRGKSECWVVVHAEPGARIIRGLHPGTTRGDYEQAVSHDRVEDVLHSFTPRVGDVVALPPGMIHAIGAGLVVAEIQQNSDLTFRIFDYKRLGLDGKPRKLHVQEALECIRFGSPGDEFSGDMNADTVTPLSVQKSGSATTELLLKGRFFDLARHSIEPNGRMTLPALPAAGVLMAISGGGSLNQQELRAGQTVLLASSLPQLEFSANMNGLGLIVSVPTAG